MSEYFVKALLTAGVDPAGKIAEWLTPLHLATRSRQSNIIGMLVDALPAQAVGDSIDVRDTLGRSPLHHACGSGRYEPVSLLLTAGADVHAKATRDRLLSTHVQSSRRSSGYGLTNSSPTRATGKH